MTRNALIPRTDQGLLALGNHIVTVLGDSGTAVYHLTVAQISAFNGANMDYGTALAACDKSVRIPSAVTTKNACRSALIDQIKLLASYVNGIGSITDAQKQDLGLPLRKKPAPIPAPGHAPFVNVLAVTPARTVTLALSAQQAGKRGKPQGVAQATVFTAPATAGVGAPAIDSPAWVYYTSTGKTQVDLAFDPSSTGNSVWVTVFWLNAKGETGPASQPLLVNLPAASQTPGKATLKMAA